MNGDRFLLDTNVIIGLLKDDGAVIEFMTKRMVPSTGNYTSQISRMELLSFSAITSDEELRIRAFLVDCSVLLIDDRIEAEAIAIRRAKRLQLPDAIVAASARVHRLKLLTLDKRLEATYLDWIGA